MGADYLLFPCIFPFSCQKTIEMNPIEATVSYSSSAYIIGFVILLVGVILPMVYMALQNKKAFKAVRRD
uniref:Uncharacterized protein n=1 Tax=Hyaloperonospora arabidopsidis (strain Emoy2) TaxID=559515 RepID=M4BJM6_HYAAE